MEKETTHVCAIDETKLYIFSIKHFMPIDYVIYCQPIQILRAVHFKCHLIPWLTLNVWEIVTGLNIFIFFVLRVTSRRSLTLSSRPSAKSTDDSTVKDEPIKFSTSKASHKTWKVDSSLGSRFERPWWKVLPVSLFCISIILWCALREETDVDKELYKNMFEPPDEEEKLE